MGRTCDLTESQVAVLKSISVNGIKQVEIAAQLGIPQSAVSKCLRNMGSNRQNCGRKRSTSERDDRQLARLAKKNRFCSSKRLAGMWKETGVVEWRHLTEQHIEGCMNRVSAAVYQL